MNKVYIAVPTKTGQVYFELLMRLLAWSHSPIEVMIHFEAFQAPIDHCRNVIVKKFLATNCTHLLMIDDDIVPPENALEQLLSHDKDIIAAACSIIGPNEHGRLKTGYNIYKRNVNGELEQHVWPNSTDLEEFDAVGTGCIMIKREVFEKIETTAHVLSSIQATKAPFRTRYDDHGIKYMGEDIYFCELAKKLDYKIYADFKLKCKHIKSCNLLEL